MCASLIVICFSIGWVALLVGLTIDQYQIANTGGLEYGA